MTVSDPRLAAQIVARGEKPRFFDDVWCLKEYLASAGAIADAAVYVADHRTGAWVPAVTAVYTRTSIPRTPMASGILAHADEASRSADPAAEGQPLSAAEILPAAVHRGEARHE
jgi:copper chaperone NosL